MHWFDMLSPVVAQTPWLIAVDVVVSGGAIAKLLRELGAEDCFIVAGSRGTGDLPPPQLAEFIELGLTSLDMMHGIRVAEHALDHLSDAVITQIDDWDPERKARVYRPFFSNGSDVAHRPCFGARPPSWQALEDKTTIDKMWEELGVVHEDVRIIAPTRRSLQAAQAMLDQGSGVVVSGDNKQGFNGGASYVRWIRSASDLDTVLPFFAETCDQVRVMPFLDGIPCSIHGFVADTVAVFRPCEMNVFRRPDACTFAYAGASNLWECNPDDTREMRELARAVGWHLKETLGYRGAFTIDGVLTAKGFRPTELNPRIGAAMQLLVPGLDMPLTLLHYAAIEGLDLDWRLDEMERRVLANPARSGRMGISLQGTYESTSQLHLSGETEGFCETIEQDATWSVRIGPASWGGNLRIEANTERMEHGPAFAPRALGLLQHLDEQLDLGIGPLTAAPELR